MEIDCPKCGTENWLENQNRCFACGAVLRRCADCTQYDREKRFCTAIKTDIELHEAESPGVLASSATCQFYRPFARVLHSRKT